MEKSNHKTNKIIIDPFQWSEKTFVFVLTILFFTSISIYVVDDTNQINPREIRNKKKQNYNATAKRFINGNGLKSIEALNIIYDNWFSEMQQHIVHIVAWELTLSFMAMVTLNLPPTPYTIQSISLT